MYVHRNILSNLSCFSFLGHCIAVDENSGVNVLVRPSKKWLRDWESFSFWNACEPLHLIGLNFVGLPKLTNFWRSMSKILSGQKLCPAKLNFVYKYSDKTGENVGLSNILSVEILSDKVFHYLAVFGQIRMISFLKIISSIPWSENHMNGSLKLRQRKIIGAGTLWALIPPALMRR